MSTVSIEQLVALNDEIASLVRGGVPLELGLRELGRDSAGRLHEISTALSARMTSGASLSEALSAEGRLLPPAYRTVVEAGIRAGRLPAALEAVSNYARELVDLRQQMTLALLYPFIVTALAYVLFSLIIVDLVHRFQETYEVFRLPLHWSFALLVRGADWVGRWWWAPPLALLALVIWWMATGGARLLSFGGLAQPLAWIPYVSRIGRRFRQANFADLLALMIEHDVPLPEGLRLAGEAVGDAPLRRGALELADAVERGAASGVVRSSGFPPFLYWAITCGQRGQPLARLLKHAATIYRRQAIGLSRWFKIVFPIAAAVVIGGGVTALYASTLFGPLAQFWNDLVHD